MPPPKPRRLLPDEQLNVLDDGSLRCNCTVRVGSIVRVCMSMLTSKSPSTTRGARLIREHSAFGRSDWSFRTKMLYGLISQCTIFDGWRRRMACSTWRQGRSTMALHFSIAWELFDRQFAPRQVPRLVRDQYAHI